MVSVFLEIVMARYLYHARGTLLYKEAVCERGKSHYGLCYNSHRLLSFFYSEAFLQSIFLHQNCSFLLVMLLIFAGFRSVELQDW